ncbi:ATP-binding protein [Brevibacillus thermoruber]|uniref:ATP-binding protein n=1 Tax=Brevibacillus thermoruber TaxID=33942 RepID=A0A9X3TVJ9_9BACL|nr:ATP-binding protein [Brevibacillus thermoruber]MDA5111160.1 ATP-binding protein [Brevibacillus thermoruber]
MLFLHNYTDSTKLLIIDEIGYLPFDSLAANLFFQVVSASPPSGDGRGHSNRGQFYTQIWT